MTLKPFSCPYHYKGRDYTAEIYGTDPDDARARLRAAFYQSTATEPQEIVFQATAPSWMARVFGGF